MGSDSATPIGGPRANVRDAGTTPTVDVRPTVAESTVATTAARDPPLTARKPVDPDPRFTAPAETQSLGSGAVAAFLKHVSPNELTAARTLIAQPAFQQLAAPVRDLLLEAATRNPKTLGVLLARAPGGDANADRDFLEGVAVSSIIASPTRALAVRAAAALDSAQRSTPRTITVVFPGQRADHGRGELMDAWRYAEIAQRAFPRAKIKFVVFHASNMLDTDPRHPSFSSAPEPNPHWQHPEVQRGNYVFDYLPDVLGLRSYWDPFTNPVVEHNGIQIVNAVAPDPAQSRLTFARDGINAERIRTVRDSHQRATHYELLPDSLGYAAISRSDVALVGGAGHIDDARILNLGRPGSPLARAVTMQFQESGFAFVAGPRVEAARTSIFAPPGGAALSDFSADHIHTMRTLAEQYRLTGGSGDAGVRANRAALLDQIFPRNQAARGLADTAWAASYAHVEDTLGEDRLNFDRWLTGLAEGAARRGPVTAFIVASPESREKYAQMIRDNLIVDPLTNGLNGFKLKNLTLVLIDPQSHAIFRSLVAGSSRTSFLTGNNSAADAVAAGTPFNYETLRGGNLPKIHELVLVAPGILRQAGFDEKAVTDFVRALPQMVGKSGELLSYEEAGKAIAPMRAYKEPDADAIRALHMDPERTLSMWRAVSLAVARDDSGALRAQIVARLNASPDPRGRIVAAAFSRGDFAGLANDAEFKAWLATSDGATHRDVVRQGALIGMSSVGFGVVGAFAGHALSDAFGLEGMGRLLTDVSIGVGTQLAMQSAATRGLEAASASRAVTGRQVLESTLRGMPRGFTTSALFGAAARSVGIESGTYAMDGAVVSGSAVADLSGAALTNYLRVAGATRAATALGLGGRLTSYVGWPLLADFIAGRVGAETGALSDYDTQVTALARRIERNGDSDWLGAVMPTTATAIAGAGAPAMQAARVVFHESAIAAEGALTNELAAILKNCGGGFKDDGWWAIRAWLSSDRTVEALRLIEAESHAPTTPFRSELGQRLRGVSTRAEAERLVRELPQIASRQIAQTGSDLQLAALRSRQTGEPGTAERTLAAALQRMTYAASLVDVAGRVPATGITGITDVEMTAMTNAVKGGALAPRDAAAILMARDNVRTFAAAYAREPAGRTRDVIEQLLLRAAPDGVAPHAADEEQRWPQAWDRTLALSRALRDFPGPRAALARQVQERLQLAGGQRIALLLWRTSRASAADQRELADLVRGAAFSTNPVLARPIRDAIAVQFNIDNRPNDTRLPVPEPYRPLIEALRSAS